MQVLRHEFFLSHDHFLLGEIAKRLVSGHELIEFLLEVDGIKMNESNNLRLLIVIHALRSDPCGGEEAIVEGLSGINELVNLLSLLHLIVLEEPVIDELDHPRLLESLQRVDGLGLIRPPNALDYVLDGLVGPRVSVHSHHEIAVLDGTFHRASRVFLDQDDLCILSILT